MVHVQRMNLRVQLLSLFAGVPVVPALELVEPQVLLEKDQDGAANWLFGDNGFRPDVRLGAIDVDRGVVRYRDPALRADISVKLQSSPAAATKTIGFAAHFPVYDDGLRDQTIT